MRRLALAIALACVVSVVARAGEIHTTGAPEPSAPTTLTTTGEIHSGDAPAPGEIHSTDAPEPQESTTVLTIVLTLIGIV